MPLADPFVQAYNPQNPLNVWDPGTELGGLYQEDAANKVAKAQVDQKKAYDSGLAGHYGVTDVASKVKGLSDMDLFNLATNLVKARRGAATQPPAGGTGGGTKPPSGTTKPPATKPPTTTTKPPATTSKTPTATKTATAPKIAAKTTTTTKAAATTAAKSTTPKITSGVYAA